MALADTPPGDDFFSLYLCIYTRGKEYDYNLGTEKGDMSSLYNDNQKTFSTNRQRQEGICREIMYFLETKATRCFLILSHLSFEYLL
jgi:hypothetical protein